MNLSNIKVNNQLVATVDDDLNLSDNLIHNKAIGKFFYSPSKELTPQELINNADIDYYVDNVNGGLIEFPKSGVIYATDFIDITGCIRIHCIMQG